MLKYTYIDVQLHVQCVFTLMSQSNSKVNLLVNAVECMLSCDTQCYIISIRDLLYSYRKTYVVVLQLSTIKLIYIYIFLLYNHKGTHIYTISEVTEWEASDSICLLSTTSENNMTVADSESSLFIFRKAFVRFPTVAFFIGILHQLRSFPTSKRSMSQCYACK